MNMTSIFTVSALAGALAIAFSGSAVALHEQSHGASKNLKLVGVHELQGRSIYNGHVREYPDGRWIAFVGFHSGSAFNDLTGQNEPNGNAMVDVTNPRKPVLLHHLPSDAVFGGPQSGGRNLQTCSGDELPGGVPGRVYLQRETPRQQELWDVTDPTNPVPLVGGTGIIQVVNGTHKNYWDCSTGIAYLTSDLAGWQSRSTVIFDISDPESFDPNTDFIRNFGLVNSQPGGSGEGRMTDIHEPFALGDRVYMAYGTRSKGILQILDNDILLNDPDCVAPHPNAILPTNECLLAPQISRLDSPDFWGVHTAVPLLDVEMPQHAGWAAGSPRDFVISVSEETQGNTFSCQDQMQHMVHFVDITDEVHPYPVSNYYVDIEGPQGVNFCERGGRFGAHSTQWNITEDHYRGRIAFFSWFNAGVRAVDIRDPYNPEEVGYYIPDSNQNTSWGPLDQSVAITNNIDVDDRGFVYLWDRAGTGMHIVRPTGQVKKIAN